MSKKRTKENDELAASHYLEMHGNRNAELHPLFSKRADACKQFSSGQFGGWSVGRSTFYTMKPIQDMSDNKKDGKQEI